MEKVIHIAELAKQVEMEDPIDWGMLTIDEDTAYHLMAANVLELLGDKYDDPETRDVVIATIVKLVVENFVLNLKLQQRENNNGRETI